MTLSRLASRLLDLLIPFVLGIVISFNFFWQSSPNFYYYLIVAVFVVSNLFSAFCISRFGSTVGYALFGITVKDRSSNNLSFLSALGYLLFLQKQQNIQIVQVKKGYLRSMLAWGLTVVTMGTIFAGNGVITPIKSMKQHFSKTMTSQIQPENWVKFHCSEKRFSVDFPTIPKIEAKRLDIFSAKKSLNYNEYQSSLGNKVHYCVSFIDFPSSYKWVGAKTLLQESLNILVDNTPDTEVLFKEFTQYKKYRALDFRLKQGSQEVVGRLVLHGNTLYRLNVVYSPTDGITLQEENFLQSLDFE